MAALFLNDALRKRIDRVAVLQRARWRFEAGLLHLFWQVCARLEPRAAAAFGQRVLGAIGPRLTKGAHIGRNLRLAFPGLAEGERDALARAIWGNAGAVLAEYPHFATICDEANFETVDQVNLEDYRAGRKQGIFVSAHVGNWELCGHACGYQGIPLTVMYAPSKNPFIERMLRRQRDALGCRLVSLEDGARALLRALGQGHSIGLVVDTRDDDGTPLPFFGMDKLTTLAPARLALRFGCALIPIRIERLGPARFRRIVHEPIRPDPALASEKDRALQMMREVNHLFEQWIRARPEQWLCFKRAWPRSLDGSPAARAAVPAAAPDRGQPAGGSA